MNPHQGDVSDYYSLGLVSADVDRHYSGLSAAQLEYAPLGQPTGLCVGVPTSPYSGEALSLQPCTVPGRTVWIIGSPTSAGFFPIISGATTDFVHPFAMTYPRHVDTDTMLPADPAVPSAFPWPRPRGTRHAALGCEARSSLTSCSHRQLSEETASSDDRAAPSPFPNRRRNT